ncbi:MAG: hypothetical protein V4489_04280 [Chlamydiota bacterium]
MNSINIFTSSLDKTAFWQFSQITIEDIVESNLDKKTTYVYKQKEDIGYVEYTQRNLSEKVFIPIELKNAIETVALCADDIIQSTKTTPAREIDNLYRAQWNKKEFIFVQADTSPKAILAVVNKAWEMQPITQNTETSFSTQSFEAKSLLVGTIETIDSNFLGVARCYSITEGKKLDSQFVIYKNE